MLKILTYFNKIKALFCGFFTNKKTLMLNEGITDIEEDILPINIDIEDDLISSSMFDTQEKSDFFAIYENVKKRNNQTQ